MKSRRILAISLTFALILSCLVFPLSVFAADPTPWDGTTATQPAGAGTAGSPYLIENGEQLKWFSDLVATANNTNYVKLTADIDLGGRPWTPIGNASCTFRGNFDGQGHTISNMVVSGIDSCGLFGRLVNATVTNVKFVGANITTNANVSGFGGVLSGYAQGSTISKISVDATSSVVGYNVGGIVGRTWSSMNTITNCVNAATVKTDGQNGGEAAGGIVGLGAVANISYCINHGTIGFTKANSEVLVGGIAGRFGGTSAATLSYCLNTGSVSSSHTAGGIAGKNMQAGCAFNNNVSTVAVTAGNADYSGSLVGRFNATATAADCYVVTSATYGITGANAGEAAKGTLTNVVAVSSESEINAMNAAAAAIVRVVLPANEAGIRVQFKDNGDGTEDMRIVGLLDSLEYYEIGYHISITYNEQNYSDDLALNYVYTSLTAKYGTEIVTPDSLGYACSGYYLTAFTVQNIPTTGTVTFELTPYSIATEGAEKVSLDTVILTLVNGEISH